MTDHPVQRRRMRDKLGFQLAFVLAVVLLPLAFISLSRSLALVSEIDARVQALVTGATMQAAATELGLIQEARGAAQTLASTIGPVVADDAACSAVMSRLSAQHQKYSLIAYIPASGQMRCSSRGRMYDFSNDPVFAGLSDPDHSGFSVLTRGPISGVSVLWVTEKVYDKAGDFIGTIVFALPHRELAESESEGGREDDLDLFTFDPEGEILTASTGFDDLSAMPRDRSLAALAGPQPIAFNAPSRQGEQRVFSVVPLVPGELYALGTRPVEGGGTLWKSFTSAPAFLPALMWLASLVVAWLGVEQLVTRNVRQLSQSIKSFARGNRMVARVDVGRAPAEIRDMAEAYESMTESVMRDEAELENIVHEKEVLLREVHHRVKNNLQLIVSIMNMQIRRVHSEDARRMLTELRDRVMNLATIHRDLFDTAGRVDIRADELLTKVVAQISASNIGVAHQFDAETDFERLQLVPDQAVPLSLLVGKAMTSAIKHGSADPQTGVLNIKIRLRRDGVDRAVLDVSNTSDGPSSDDQEKIGLGGQLTAAFAMQLGGKVEREYGGGRYRLRVAFPLRRLVEAESRHHAAQDDAQVA